MPRQLVRLSEVRNPQLTNDNYTPAQIQDAEANSRTTEDYLQYILSQIRLIQGTQSWKEPPVQNLTAVAATMEQVQADMAAVAQLSEQVSSLATMLANVGTTYAPLSTLQEVQAAIEAINAQIQKQVSTNSGLIANLTNSITILQAQASALSQQIANLVTPTGLLSAISNATLFDQRLIGPQNRLNRTFQTPAKYVLATLRVFLNGQRLSPGNAYDYVAAESSQGLGYNQIVLTTNQPAPTVRDTLTADYIPAQS